MLNFGFALFAFLAAHVIPRSTGLRDWGIARFGRKSYMMAYSLMSLGLLVWLLSAAINAPYLGLWVTTQLSVTVAIIVMFFACIIFSSGVIRSNSLSISFRGGETDLDNPGILALVRHPIIFAFLLWSAAHLLVNGDVVGVILFGGMLLFSVLGLRIALRRATKRLSADQLAKYLTVDQGPIGERIRRAMSAKFAVEIATGSLLFLALLFGHQYFIGVSPLVYF